MGATKLQEKDVKNSGGLEKRRETQTNPFPCQVLLGPTTNLPNTQYSIVISGPKIGRSRTPKKTNGNSFLHPDENIHINTSRPPSHNLPYV